MLWFSLWLSLHSGDIENIGSAGTILGEFNSLRAIIPLLSGLIGTVIVCYALAGQRQLRRIFVGPMGLMVVYGFVGIIASSQSPDFSVAIYWVAIYLAVPAVAYAIVFKGNHLVLTSQILRFNWVVVTIAVVVLIVLAFSFLNLHKIILEPSNLLECRLRVPFHGESWLELTSGKLRSTGVGRYAALATILSISGIWHGKGRGRALWAFIFVAAFLLLVTSGARTSYIGVAFAVPLVIFLHGGWKASLLALGGVVFASGIIWGTGWDRTVIESCFLSGYDSNSSALQITPTTDPLTGAPVYPINPKGETTPVPTPVPGLGLGPKPTLTPTPVSPKPSISAARGVPVPIIDKKAGKPVTFLGRINVPSGLFTFSGRTVVWESSWDYIVKSPFVGYGFQGDRLVLGTHVHNSVLHALFQTGWIGLIPFLTAFLWGWYLLIRILFALSRLPMAHRYLLIQSAGVLTFLTMRTIWESTGAFFGVDWLFLSVILLYIQLVKTELLDKPET